MTSPAAAVSPDPAELLDLWSDAERLAWTPPAPLRPSQWAEQERYLTRRQTSRPGPWDNRKAPTLAGIMDIAVRHGVNELWIEKAAQIGGSEAIRTLMGYFAHRDPDPILLVLPNEKDGRKIVGKRIIPLFEDTPCLKELATGAMRDKKLTQILLSNGFNLQLAWSGSPSSLASDPIRIVVLDEVNKFEEFSGREAAAVDLARVRTRTYKDRRLIIAISTPTTADGAISQGHDDCPIKLKYFVPCPHCGTFQRLVYDRLRWEKFAELPHSRDQAARIRARDAAWYECEKCPGRILEAHKPAILWAGYWGTEDGAFKLFVDGREEGIFPEGNKVGLHLPALYDLSTPFSEIAAESVEAGRNPKKLMHLRNSTLAERFEQQVSKADASVFARKCRSDPARGFAPPPAKTVPRWASRLVMSVDTQKDHFWYVIRAWGYRFRSQRVHHGRVTSFEDLREIFYRAYFPYEGGAYPPIRCHTLGIDSGGGKMGLDGSRTDEVYQFCRADPISLHPLKGASKPSDRPNRLRKVTYSPPNARRDPYEVWLHLLDTNHYQDLLATWIEQRNPVIDLATGELTAAEEDQWLLNDADDDEYNRHLGNMHKVRAGIRSTAEIWKPKTEGARVDYRDCEVYNLAMAHGPAKCYALPSPEQLAAQINAARQAAQQAPKPMTDPHGRPFLATDR